MELIAPASASKVHDFIIDAVERYLEVVRSDRVNSYFDVIILTATDEKQKILYEHFVRQRVGLRQIPRSTKVIVIADPPPTTHRVGNGGAVLNCLRVLKKKGLNWNEKRILVILSGGYSKRSPNLAAAGKAFAPIPYNVPLGCPVPTIVDLKLALLLPYGSKTSPAGIYVAAGDVYDVMDGRNFPVSSTGITGFAHLDTCEYGSNHGVFEILCTTTATTTTTSTYLKTVANYHQKEKVENLQRIANTNQCVLTDGDFFMASDVCEALYQTTASCALPLPGGELCSWTHFFDACIPFDVQRNKRKDIELMYVALNKFQLFALDVSSDPSHFFSHVGTMPEYLDLFISANVNLIGSVLKGSTTCPKTSLVEYSNLCDCIIGERAIVSGVVASKRNFPQDTITLGLHYNKNDIEEYVLFQYPLKEDMKSKFASQSAIDNPITIAEALMFKSVHPTLASFSVAFDTKAVIVAASNQLTRPIILPEPEKTKDWNEMRPIEINLPVRLILAGGWSDTPPMSLVHGGAVFNIAVKVNGELPLRILVQGAGSWYFECDGESSNSLTIEPNDPCALIKVCLNILGPQFTIRPLKIITRSNVPNGSGLGTSSILMLGVLRAVLQVYELSFSLDEESDLVLATEQALGSGGGWQDQIGGGISGAKFVSGNTGGNLTVVPIAIKPNVRFLCLNSQIRRRAKVVLDRVVEGYKEGRNVDVFAIDLPENARKMKEAFESGDLEAAGQELGRYRDLCNTLAPNFLPQELEPIMAYCAKFCYGEGVNLMGAGAGGFIVGFLKKDFNLAGAIKIANEVGVDVEISELSIA